MQTSLIWNINRIYFSIYFCFFELKKSNEILIFMNIKKMKLKLNFLHMTCLYSIIITISKLSYSNGKYPK